MEVICISCGIWFLPAKNKNYVPDYINVSWGTNLSSRLPCLWQVAQIQHTYKTMHSTYFFCMFLVLDFSTFLYSLCWCAQSWILSTWDTECTMSTVISTLLAYSLSNVFMIVPFVFIYCTTMCARYKKGVCHTDGNNWKYYQSCPSVLHNRFYMVNV